GPARKISATIWSAAMAASVVAQSRSSALQLTSGHSWRAVLTSPARPPLTGSHLPVSLPKPNEPSSRDTASFAGTAQGGPCTLDEAERVLQEGIVAPAGRREHDERGKRAGIGLAQVAAMHDE